MKNNITQPTKLTDIKRNWHLIDAKEKILGRVSTDIAKLLMGKTKTYFAKNMDCGDYVVVINAKKVKVSGNKETQKLYRHHTGYPGGLKSATLSELRSKNPERIIKHAVKGMLPKNKLQAKMLKRLYIFAEDNHLYKDKFST